MIPEEEREALQKLSNTVHLKEKDKKYQFIYGTHLYGTTFSLFAKFDAEESGDNMKINNIHFIGVNYKGLLGLKIEHIDKPTNIDGFVEIKVNLKAENSGASTHTQIKTIPTNIEVTSTDVLKVVRELIPMSDHYYDKKATKLDRAFKDGIFDSEFFVRDGLFLNDRSSDWEVLRPEDDISIEPDGLPGSNCKFGFSDLRFG